MHLATSTVELIAAVLVWGFDFDVPMDSGLNVNKFEVSVAFEPLPFRCCIKPQSAAKADPIRNNFASYQPLFDKLRRDL
ncbi:hypothetical protein FRC02_000196 [Tulasnella sp. 418]|nr:hypothetical protein FRC02_000196 [Tulasnella sp. 418]